jgi:LuxR family maltose regulon positive regulatory protein
MPSVASWTGLLAPLVSGLACAAVIAEERLHVRKSATCQEQRLLATDVDGPDIASQLIVSLNTMRTHTKSIYSKLGVNNRRAAVRRAEELELL